MSPPLLFAYACCALGVTLCFAGAGVRARRWSLHTRLLAESGPERLRLQNQAMRAHALSIRLLNTGGCIALCGAGGLIALALETLG